MQGKPHADTPGVTIGAPRAYELCGAVCFAGRRHRAFARLAALSGAEAGDRVLDVGCGTGYLTRHMATAVGPQGAVTGVDPSPTVLAYARRKSQSGRGAPCTYQEGIAEALDLPDASFDTVVTSLMLHHLPEELRPVALGEMCRVLRPGGRLLVVEFRPPTSRIGRHLVHGGVGHAMSHNRVDLLDGLVTGTGFEVRGSGDVRPWLTYVQAARPVTTEATDQLSQGGTPALVVLADSQVSSLLGTGRAVSLRVSDADGRGSLWLRRGGETRSWKTRSTWRVAGVWPTGCVWSSVRWCTWCSAGLPSS
jgi:ubiquinone/menaquinone biosynthesis C-methylase UbiE